MAAELLGDRVARDVRNAILPIAQRVDRLIHKHTIAPFRERLMRWLILDAETYAANDKFKQERLEFALANRHSALADDGIPPAGSQIEYETHLDEINRFVQLKTIYPKHLSLLNEPKNLQPIPIPTHCEPSLDLKFVAMSIIRDAFVGGEPVVEEPDQRPHQWWTLPAFGYHCGLIQRVQVLVATDAHKLELWCNDVEKELQRKPPEIDAAKSKRSKAGGKRKYDAVKQKHAAKAWATNNYKTFAELKASLNSDLSPLELQKMVGSYNKAQARQKKPTRNK